MARRPKPETRNRVHLSTLIDAELIARVDAAAQQMAQADPYHRTVTRTDAIQHLLRLGLDAFTAHPPTSK